MTISNDLICEILRRVPVKHLLRYRCVSKGWCSLIDSPEFVKIHIHAENNGGLIVREPGKLYLADYESLHDDVTNPIEIVDPVIKSDAKLVGSANGLVCFYTSNYNVILMNPSTRKCITLPREPDELRCTFHHKYFGLCKGGFGYDHVSDDYKFVRFGMCGNRYAEIIVTVYSVRTNSWTHIQNARLSRDIYLNDQWGRFAGGALYWKADYGKKTEIIVAFDLGLGQFREVAWPADRNFGSLYGFGGNLYTLKFSKSRVDVFKMNEYSAEKPWSKAFTVMGKNVFDYGFKPLMYLEGLGEVLILVDNKRPVWHLESESFKKVLILVDNKRPVWYHLESESFKKVRINQIRRLTSNAEFYTESLFQFPKDRQPQNLLNEIRGTKQQQKKRETTAEVANSKRKKQLN